MIALLLLFVKSALVLGAVLLLCTRTRAIALSAAQRHAVLVLAMLCLPALALLTLVPDKAVTINLPVALAALDVELVPIGDSAAYASKLARNDRTLPLADVVHWLYLVAACALLVIWLLRLLRTARWIGETTPIVFSHSPMNTNKVRVSESRNIRSPVTWGWRQAEIVLPSQWSQWSDDKLSAVLCHELAHVQRRDTLVTSACALLCCLFWFQPLAWWTLRRLQLEAEHACDDRVVHRGFAEIFYAEQLLEIARDEQPRSALAMAALNTLPARVHALLDESTRRHPMTLKHWTIALGVTLSVLLPISTIDATATTQEPHLLGTDGGLLPLVKVSPEYSEAAKAQGLKGYVEVQFTVNEKGLATDPIIVSAQPAGVFDDAALKALTFYRYKPAIADGVPQPVSGVRVRFAFGPQGGGSVEQGPLQATPAVRQSLVERLMLMRTHIDSKNYSTAAEILAELKQDLDSRNANERGQIHNMAGYLAFQVDDTKGALSEYEQVLAQGQSIPEGLRSTTLFTVAQLNFVLQDYAAALQYIEQWTEEADNPGHIPLIFMGQVHYQLQDYPAAISKLNEGIGLATQRGESIKENWWALLNYLYYEEEQWTDVIRVLETLVRDFPKPEYSERLVAVRRMVAQAES